MYKNIQISHKFNNRNEISIFNSVLKLLTDSEHSEAMRHVPTTALRSSARSPLMETDIRLFSIREAARHIAHSSQAEQHVFTYSILPSGIVWTSRFKSGSLSAWICHSARAERYVPSYSKLPSGTADRRSVDAPLECHLTIKNIIEDYFQSVEALRSSGWEIYLTCK